MAGMETIEATLGHIHGSLYIHLDKASEVDLFFKRKNLIEDESALCCQSEFGKQNSRARSNHSDLPLPLCALHKTKAQATYRRGFSGIQNLTCSSILYKLLSKVKLDSSGLFCPIIVIQSV